MNRRLISVAVFVVVFVVGAAVVYSRFMGDTAPPSGPITAVPLDLSTATPAAAAAAPTEAAAPTSAAEPTAAPSATAAAEPSATAASEPTAAADVATATVAATAAAEPTATSAPEPTAAPAASGPVRFAIASDQSEARFKLGEDLRGQPVEVVGTTNQVAGEIAVSPDDLSQIKVGTITVSARALATDSEQRNRAIRNFILNTDQFEFITFTPKAITGLSGAGAVGQDYTFEIAGDLTIRDVTKPVTFKATVKAESPEKLTGSATAVVNREDFGLNIPSVPFVANVTTDVTLEISFVALPVK